MSFILMSFIKMWMNVKNRIIIIISPWSVPKLILKLIQSLIEFILCDQIASIMTHLKHKWK